VDRSVQSPPTALQSAAGHWPEYAAEALGLGLFMVAAGVVATVLEAPDSELKGLLPNESLRRAIGGLAMGLTAVALIYSPWGKRSGAHMNPAVTLAFWRLGKIKTRDALGYVAAQFVGGLLGVLLVAAVFGMSFTERPVLFAVTLPGSDGVPIAFAAELAISMGMMLAVLHCAERPRLAPYTGLVAGILVATYIALEAPLSGMSMNPARSFASAAPALQWQHLWLYFTAPPLGMLLATQVHLALHGAGFGGCAKLVHTTTVRCIHCEFEPTYMRGAP
jgi:aquaporin Z